MCPILLCTCFQNVQKLCLLGIYLLCCQEYFSFANDYIHRSHYNTFAPAFLFVVLLSCIIAQQCQSSLNEDAHHVLVSDDFLFESSDLYLFTGSGFFCLWKKLPISRFRFLINFSSGFSFCYHLLNLQSFCFVFSNLSFHQK